MPFRDLSLSSQRTFALKLESPILEVKFSAFCIDLARWSEYLGHFYAEPLISYTVHTVVFPGPMPFSTWI